VLNERIASLEAQVQRLQKELNRLNSSKPRSLEGLDFLWLEITPSCNLHCEHCYTESSPLLKDPKIVDWQKVLADGRVLGCKMVQFIGGEPTFHSGLLDYVRTAHQLGYSFIEVYTNLTLMTDDFLAEFSRFNVNVATSFYSNSEETHDKITGVKGSFRRTVLGIRKVLDRKIPLRVGMVVTEANKEEIESAKTFLVELGVEKNNIRVDQTRPVGRGAGLTPYESLGETLCGKCWQGKLTVSWDGTCYPCVFARTVKVGNLLTMSLSEIVASAELGKFRRFVYSYRRGSDSEFISQCAPDCDPECNPGNCDPTCGPHCAPTCDPECQPGTCDPMCGPHCAPTCDPECGPGNCDPMCDPHCAPTCAPES
jgi:MoaA/NifB/PqqE/SkfB family radical SAM enzyme